MQPTKGKVTGQVRIWGAREAKLKEILALFKRCAVKIVSPQPTISLGTSNRHEMTMNVEYGPVWGGWESDVRKRVIRLIEKSGSTAKFDFVNLRRDIVETRLVTK